MPCRFNTLACAHAAAGVMHHAPGKRFGRALMAAAALAATMTAAMPALADSGGAWIEELDQAAIKVASDGERYTTVLNSSPPITGMMAIYLNAHKEGRVRAWELWPSIQAENKDKMQFPEFKQSKKYSLDNRPKTVNGALPFSIPRQSYKTYAEEACNELAKDLQLLHGKTNAEIFAEDRSIAIQVDAEVTWDMSLASNDDPARGVVTGEAPPNPNIKPVTIVCLKTPPAPPAVTSAALVVQGFDPVNFQGKSQGKCRMQLNGVLRSNLPNLDISFRYVDDEGNQSDLKTVTTDSDRWASFEHSYPLSPGQKSSKIRMVGQSPSFTSAWKEFDYECEQAMADDFVANDLPPTAHQLEVGATAAKVRLKGYVCPAQAKMIGVFKGHGDASGHAALIANGGVLKLKPYITEKGSTEVIDEEYDLSWGQIEGPLEQEVEFVLRIDNAEGVEIDRLTKTETFSCVDRGMPDQLTSNDPTPPVLSLSAISGEERLYQGYICPENIRLSAAILGQDTFDGRAVIVTKQQQSLFEAQSQVEEFNFSVEENEGILELFEPLVKWSNVPVSGDAPPKQTMDLSFRVVKTGGVVASVEQSLEVSCKAMSVPSVGVFDKPKSYNLSLSQLGNQIRNGYVCPTKVSMGGFVQSGSEGFSGSVSYFTGGVLRHTQEVELAPNHGHSLNVDHVLDWDYGAFPEKTVDYAFRVENQHGIEVGAKEVTEQIACEKIETNRDPAYTDFLPSESNPTQAQQGRTPAAAGQFALQTAPVFAIQAPKGRVRAGRIQLSGGAANAKYDLRFYRADGGGYRMLRSAQLPRQMTGRSETFNLKALSGSRSWRIEVCPAGSKNKRVCKTSEFQLPSQRRSSKGTPRADTAGTKVFILPGQGG